MCLSFNMIMETLFSRAIARSIASLNGIFLSILVLNPNGGGETGFKSLAISYIYFRFYSIMPERKLYVSRRVSTLYVILNLIGGGKVN